MWELDYKEGWAPKNWCFWTVVLEKTLESPLDCKEIQSVHPKGNQSWIFIGRTDGEAETLNILATWCEELTHWKRPWCWERLKARGEGDDRVWEGWMASPTRWTWVWVNSACWWWQGGLACCSPRGRKESDTAERLNWTELNWGVILKIPPLTSKKFFFFLTFCLASSFLSVPTAGSFLLSRFQPWANAPVLEWWAHPKTKRSYSFPGAS